MASAAACDCLNLIFKLFRHWPYPPYMYIYSNWRFKNVDVTFGLEYLLRACSAACIDVSMPEPRASMVTNMRQCEHYIAIARRNPINCFEVQDHDIIC